MQTETAPGPAQPSGGRHNRRRAAGIPLPVWAAVGVNVAMMIIFSLLYPAYYEFDESAHVSRVLATQAGLVLPTPGYDPYVTGVAVSYARYATPDLQPFVNYTPLPRDQRPSMVRLGGAAAYQRNLTLPEQLSQHPPGYYLLGAGVLDAIPLSSHLAWDKTIWLLRLMDIVLMAPLPIIAWAVTRRFARRGVAVAMAFAPLSMPGLERLGGAVTNDDLLIVLTSVFVLLLARVVADGDRRTSTGVLMGLTIAISLLVKGFALVFPLVAVLAYALLWFRERPVPWRPVIAVLVGSALGGAWWVHNVIVFGVVQPGGLTLQEANTVWPPLPNGAKAPLSMFVRKASDELTTDFWGALGLANPPSLPGVITVVATVVLILLIVVGLIVPSSDVLRGRRLDLVVLLLPTVLIGVIVLVHGADSYRTTGTLAGIQGRYFYYGLVGMLAATARGIDLLLDRLPALVKVLPALACIVGLVVSGIAFWTVIIKLWLPGNESPRHYLPRVARSIGAHSPWPAPITLTLLALCAVASIFALVTAIASRSSEQAVSA